MSLAISNLPHSNFTFDRNMYKFQVWAISSETNFQAIQHDI